MTISGVKLLRLGMNMELWDQLAEATAAWDALKLDMKEEIDALTEVNRKAYEVIELIYDDFRETYYGSASWDLNYGEGEFSRVVETVKNCRRAHELNMERVRLKNLINEKAGAALEIKSW